MELPVRESLKKKFRKQRNYYNPQKNLPVKVVQHDWMGGKERLSLNLRNELRHANRSITILAGYFIPGRRIRRLLRKATKRNVQIRLILPGISDVIIARKATKYFYAWMLRNNMQIYEWRKTILHGKITIVDDKWVSLGSYNINYLSDYRSIETNIETREKISVL